MTKKKIFRFILVSGLLLSTFLFSSCSFLLYDTVTFVNNTYSDVYIVVTPTNAEDNSSFYLYYGKEHDVKYSSTVSYYKFNWEAYATTHAGTTIYYSTSNSGKTITFY